jgi:PIN domain nuclease of toxin-antitoxin system
VYYILFYRNRFGQYGQSLGAQAGAGIAVATPAKIGMAKVWTGLDKKLN